MRLALVVTTRGTANVAIVTGVTARLALAPLLALALVVGSGALEPLGASGLSMRSRTDLALLVDLEDAHLDLVADGEDVLDLVNAALGNARDVKQAVLAGKELDEGTEGLDADNAAQVLLAHLGDLDDGLDAGGGVLGSTIGAGDEDVTVLLDVNRGARVILDATDDLAAGADDVANLVSRDLDGDRSAERCPSGSREVPGSASSMAFRMKARPS